MKIKLLRGSNTVKEIEFAATLPPLEIQRLAVDLMFENFERNQTHLWPHEEDIRGSRYEIQVMSDEGMLLKSFDIREIVKDAGLKFLGRRVDVQAWGDGWLIDQLTTESASFIKRDTFAVVLSSFCSPIGYLLSQ